MTITYSEIGLIRTPFKTLENMPIQPAGAGEIKGQVIVRKAFLDGLSDIDGFSHIILLYHFHHSKGFDLRVKPFLDDNLRGVFSTRAPRRPNAIGLSVVELLNREASVLHVKGVDVLDGTPLLDIKPYVPQFDGAVVRSVGWLEGKLGKAESMRSDDRFIRSGDS